MDPITPLEINVLLEASHHALDQFAGKMAIQKAVYGKRWPRERSRAGLAIGEIMNGIARASEPGPRRGEHGLHVTAARDDSNILLTVETRYGEVRLGYDSDGIINIETKE